VNFEGARCAVWPLYEPQILAPWRLYDASRYAAGLPWDGALMQVAGHAIRAASPILDKVSPLLESIAPFVNPIAEALDPLREVGSNGTNVATTVATSDAGPTGFLERLIWYRGMIGDTLAAGVPSGEPQRHLYGLVKDFIDRPGKGLRPALCIATARALGGRAEDAYPAAAGLEMLHNAFMVHDDVEDGSHWRRGAATMHRRAGVPIAVNAGDAMNALAMRLFRKAGERIGPTAALRIFDEIDHLLVETLEGQAMELGWARDNDLTLGTDDYLRLVLKKTAWYTFIHPMRIGALVANGDDQNLGRFDRFGYLLGLAFQITDDILNLTGSLARYGKEIDGDLWEGKRTLVLTHALDHANCADRAWIKSFLSRARDRRLPREVWRLRQIIMSGGSVQWAQQTATAFAEAAALEFQSSAFAGSHTSPDLEWIRGCIDFLLRRDA
jgi:geranylgeranyl pyrophosphate synthase